MRKKRRSTWELLGRVASEAKGGLPWGEVLATERQKSGVLLNAGMEGHMADPTEGSVGITLREKGKNGNASACGKNGFCRGQKVESFKERNETKIKTSKGCQKEGGG